MGGFLECLDQSNQDDRGLEKDRDVLGIWGDLILMTIRMFSYSQCT